MNRYTTVLFDMDGTLIDSGEGVTKSVAYALEHFGIRITDRRELYRFIGPPLMDSFQNFYGFDKKQSELAVEYFHAYYNERGVFDNRVYDGIPETLASLAENGICVMVATSKPEYYARLILDKLDLSKYFTFVAGATMDETRTEKSEVLAYALANADSPDRSKTLMVGDRRFDIDGAKAVGVDSAGVLFGYGTEEELCRAGATYLVSRALDLLPIVFGTEGRNE